GARFADALAVRGAKLAVLDRAADRAEKVAAETASRHGVRARGWQVDVAERAALAGVRASIEAALGPATVLVNAAAAKSDGFFDPFESYRLEDWEEVMRSNVTGAMLASQEFGVGMAAA